MLLRSFFLSLAFLTTALLGTTSAQTRCSTQETLTIAELGWLSAAMEARVLQRILEDGYGCNTGLMPAEMIPTATSMLTKNQPTIAPEFWVSTAASVWEKLMEKGNVYLASNTYVNGGREGWWVPDYVLEANPGLRSVEDLKSYPELFQEITSDGKGRVYGCPPGAFCEIISNNLFKALELDKHGFEEAPFQPGSWANIKVAIARKAARKQAYVGYYWGPTAVVGKYNLKLLEMPPYQAEEFACLASAECENPPVTGWAKGTVGVVAVTTLKTQAPEVAEMIGKMSYPNEVVNRVLAWADDNSADSDEVVEYFLKNHEEVWTPWVPADVAARVKATL
jgi:glycine betaine/proline transport system substrate-binding protein